MAETEKKPFSTAEEKEEKQTYTLRGIGRDHGLEDKAVKGTLTDAAKAAAKHGKGEDVKIGIIDEAGCQVFTVVCGNPQVTGPEEPVIFTEEEEEEKEGGGGEGEGGQQPEPGKPEKPEKSEKPEKPAKPEKPKTTRSRS